MGVNKTQAVIEALRARLKGLRNQRRRRSLADELDEIAEHCAALPVRDDRPADAIIGYNET